MIGLNRMYLRDTNIILICYDITNAESLESAKVWIDEINETAPSEIVLALGGNKSDLN